MNIYLKRNIKRLMLFLILTLSLICKTKPEDKYFWYTTHEVISNADKLQPGDILILSKSRLYVQCGDMPLFLMNTKK